MSRLSSLRPELAAHLQVNIGERGRLSVRLPVGERSHTVRFREEDGWIEIEGRIGEINHLARIRSHDEVAAAILQTNLSATMAGLRVDDSGHLIAVSAVPSNAPIDEFVSAALRVARLADRWEELWMGDDRH